jgi:hypothetical protein
MTRGGEQGSASHRGGELLNLMPRFGQLFLKLDNSLALLIGLRF